MLNQDTTTHFLAEERTLLSVERTFSAWIRTALSVMAGGLALLKLVSFKTDLHILVAHWVGRSMIAWGFVIIFISWLDYKKTRDRLTVAKNYKSTSFGFLLIVLPLLIMAAMLMWVTFVHKFEK